MYEFEYNQYSKTFEKILNWTQAILSILIIIDVVCILSGVAISEAIHMILIVSWWLSVFTEGILYLYKSAIVSLRLPIKWSLEAIEEVYMLKMTAIHAQEGCLRRSGMSRILISLFMITISFL